jgi:hypothetical protein
MVGEEKTGHGPLQSPNSVPLKVRVLKLEGGMQAFYGVGGVSCNKRQFQVGVGQSGTRVIFRGVIWVG